ncbi:carboxymuconolactone decarboxylase family protein [Desulfovibrio sp. JC010]|uniref:carboxymuconolactone decarboxylase family protein n=1 Tax=Desulfovibrio sp. JC010 TaxID=2593641 RepID=UPI0013D620E4|nr:hypothetical protein [Desulfovibrio sp. JC010]NDV28124.1 hypothetical protein [Desulfovibrio sp. JC010]
MLIIDHLTRENATGLVKDFYSRIPETIEIPAPMLVMSGSEGLFEKLAGTMSYFGAHESFEPYIPAAIRYIIASLKGYQACIDFNEKLLMAMGVDTEELKTLATDPLKSNFAPNERALLDFAKLAVTRPEEIDAETLEAIKAEGWKESDLVDAVYHAASVGATEVLTKTFSI